jgi:glucose-1-phosphate thymidylyltransferase
MDTAIILARGLGTRMRREDPQAALSRQQEEIAATGVKALIPIQRPFLDYVLSALADAGYRRVGLVIGPEHQTLREYYGQTLAYTRLSVDFAVQEQPLGTADAVAAAEALTAGRPFLMINSDNYYPVDALQSLRGLNGPGLAVFTRDSMLRHSNIPADRLRQFAVVEVDALGYMRRIVEKPDPQVLAALPEPVGVSMNCWRFDARIFAACRAIGPSPRGELEITDAVQHAIDHLGVRFRALPFEAAVLDLSSRSDVGPVSRFLAGAQVRL